MACAAPPVPNIAPTPAVSLTREPVIQVTSTLTAAQVPDAAADEAEDTGALTRAIVSLTRRGTSSYRALNFCEVPQGVRFQNRERVYCLHPETISFDTVTTALGEVMNERFALRDENGTELVYDNGRRCEFNLCYVHVWYARDNPANAYALLRLYPLEANGKQVAPLLRVKPNGNPQVLNDWQVVLADQRTGEIVQVLADPFVPMARRDTVAFNPRSGYFEVLDRSGNTPRPTDKKLGLPFRVEPVTELAAIVNEVALYNFNSLDVAYFENALTWLADKMPGWHEYFLAQRPLEIYRDASLPFVSDGVCCRTRNANANLGRIRFRDHLANWTRDSFPGASHDALARWSLLTLLIHEATHVRDLRTDRFQLGSVPSGMRDCVMHISTDEIEVLFSKQAAGVTISPSALTQSEYTATIENFYQDIENRLLVEKKQACGNLYKPIFPGLMP